MSTRTALTKRVGIGDHVLPYTVSSVGLERMLAIARLGPGVMLKGGAGAAALTGLRQGGYEGPVILDPACYEDEPTSEDQSSLLGEHQRWLDPQLTHNVSVLVAPSVGIHANEMNLIPNVLKDGAAFAQDATHQLQGRDVVVPVNVYGRWLTSNLDALIELLGASRQTIGIVLTDPTDPLDGRGRVAALAKLVEVLPRCVVIRTDIAGLGALACGAEWVTIGTSSTTRHAAKPGGRGHSFALDDKTPSILVEDLLGYRRASKLEQLEGVDDVLRCRCATCGDRDLRRFADPAFFAEAHAHNAATVTRLAKDLVIAQHRRQEWVAWCKRAVDTHAWVRTVTGVALDTPLPLREWAQLP